MRKISQGAFAERLGISSSWLSRIMTGQADPSEPVLMLVSEIEGLEHCYPDYLYAKAKDWGGPSSGPEPSTVDPQAAAAMARAQITDLHRKALKAFDDAVAAMLGKAET